MDNQSTSTHSMAFWEKLEFLDNTWPTDEERSFSGDLYVDGKNRDEGRLEVIHHSFGLA
ncbi:hypothetical protein N5K55_07345 [Pseudomonas aeruginosa]|nr:hypothetical protein [Pseudomonas aeruginosa]